MANDNGKNPPPPESLHFERREVACQSCGKVFEHIIMEKIDDLAQLRCGDVLISKTEMVCLHCGWVFYWNTPAKGLEKMAVTYGALMVVIKGYNPE